MNKNNKTAENNSPDRKSYIEVLGRGVEFTKRAGDCLRYTKSEIKNTNCNEIFVKLKEKKKEIEDLISDFEVILKDAKPKTQNLKENKSEESYEPSEESNSKYRNKNKARLHFEIKEKMAHGDLSKKRLIYLLEILNKL